MVFCGVGDPCVARSGQTYFTYFYPSLLVERERERERGREGRERGVGDMTCNRTCVGTEGGFF